MYVSGKQTLNFLFETKRDLSLSHKQTVITTFPELLFDLNKIENVHQFGSCS